jgi:hypothetical protein
MLLHGGQLRRMVHRRFVEKTSLEIYIAIVSTV